MAVKVYSTPTSAWCRQAKAFLRSKRVAFKEIDVSDDPRRLRELRAVSGQRGVPVVTDGTRTVIGFDKRALAALAAAAKRGTRRV